MKKAICLLLVLVVCMSLACTAFASEAGDDFVESPGIEVEDCEHKEPAIVSRREPTCTQDGYTGDKVCPDCGEVIERGTVIPRLGHRYENGVCTICGADQRNPQTGDNSGIGLWIGLMILAAVALVTGTVVYRKKFANQ